MAPTAAAAAAAAAAPNTLSLPSWLPLRNNYQEREEGKRKEPRETFFLGGSFLPPLLFAETHKSAKIALREDFFSWGRNETYLHNAFYVRSTCLLRSGMVV